MDNILLPLTCVKKLMSVHAKLICLARPAVGLNPTLKSLNTCEKAMFVCMYVEGIPTLLGSPSICHRARGVNCHKSGHCTPHDQHMVKKLTKTGV